MMQILKTKTGRLTAFKLVWKWYQLVAKVLVPAHVQDGDAKRPLSAGLGVRLRKATIGMFFYIFH